MTEASRNALPDGWTFCTLADIAQLNPPLDRCVVADDVAVDFVPMRAVEEEGGGVLRPEVAPHGKVKKGYTAFIPGDVIMAKITPCMENGKTCVVPDLPHGVCFGSTEFHVIRAERDVESRWIAYFLLQHATRQAAQRQMMGGVGQMRVPTAFLEMLSLPVPPHAEQLRVLDSVEELLSELDAGVRTLESIQAKLRQYRAAVLKAAVEGTLTAEWRKAHPDVEPASELLKRILTERRRRWKEAQLKKYKDAGKEPPRNWGAKYHEPSGPGMAALPALPGEWQWTTAQHLAWDSSYGTSEKCGETATGLPVLRIPNVVGGRLDLADLKYARSDYDVPSEEFLSVGDLLIVRTNGSRTLIGRGAVVREPLRKGAYFASYLIRLRLVPIEPLLGWIGLFWGSPGTRNWIETRAATSAGQHNVSLSLLEAMSIPLPPEAEQSAIVELVDEQVSLIDHLDSDLKTKLESAQALRQSILKAAFEGKLVPQDPNDEPASELLKRIAAERTERERVAKQSKWPVKPAKVRGSKRRQSVNAVSTA